MKAVRITYFVHGSTGDNERGLASGWGDVRLSDLGRRQSLELKGLLKGKEFDALFCSDLKRAEESARLAFGSGARLARDRRLREIDYGRLTGSSSERIDGMMEARVSEPFPGGESYMDVESRVRGFLEDLLAGHPGESVAIVAHRAPQLALDVLLKGRTWKQAIQEDWRRRGEWNPGWEYVLAGGSLHL
jgi:broad specificity phosphatase PhoE